jgi:hypothetical protein
MFPAIMAALSPVLGQVAKNLFPDPQDELKRLELQNNLSIEVMKNAQSLEQAAADIVKTEAASQHWLAANWRPIMMLTFGGLIVARWMGWAAPELSEAEYLKLWDIVELGLGGYVIGRSAEKIAPIVAGALKR